VDPKYGACFFATWNFELAHRFWGKFVRHFPKLPMHPLSPDTLLSTAGSSAAFIYA